MESALFLFLPILDRRSFSEGGLSSSATIALSKGGFPFPFGDGILHKGYFLSRKILCLYEKPLFFSRLALAKAAFPTHN